MKGSGKCSSQNQNPAGSSPGVYRGALGAPVLVCAVVMASVSSSHASLYSRTLLTRLSYTCSSRLSMGFPSGECVPPVEIDCGDDSAGLTWRSRHLHLPNALHKGTLVFLARRFSPSRDQPQLTKVPVRLHTLQVQGGGTNTVAMVRPTHRRVSACQ